MSNFIFDTCAVDGDEFVSNSIEAVYYDREQNRLGVEFQTNETVYAYDGVAESTYNIFIKAPSLNAFYRTFIQKPGTLAVSYEGAAEREVELEEPLADWERELLSEASVHVGDPAEFALVESNRRIANPDKDRYGDGKPMYIDVPTVSLNRFGVTWTSEGPLSGIGPNTYFVEAPSVSDAIRLFNEELTRTEALFGPIDAKIVSVTHYFE